MLAERTLSPPGGRGQDRCLSESEANEILHGLYPLNDLGRRLDHVDGCASCSDLFATVVLLAVFQLEFSRPQVVS